MKVSSELFIKKMANIEYLHYYNIHGCIKTKEGFISSSGCKMFLVKVRGESKTQPTTDDICDHPHKIQ